MAPRESTVSTSWTCFLKSSCGIPAGSLGLCLHPPPGLSRTPPCHPLLVCAESRLKLTWDARVRHGLCWGSLLQLLMAAVGLSGLVSPGAHCRRTCSLVPRRRREGRLLPLNSVHDACVCVCACKEEHFHIDVLLVSQCPCQRGALSAERDCGLRPCLGIFDPYCWRSCHLFQFLLPFPHKAS